MRTCIIFNPTAKGDKARHFRRHLDEIGAECQLKATGGPGDARRLAAEAVAEGFELVTAAGGDGTVNEVLNGLADAPKGFERSCLGVIPLGTVNVFARELEIPTRLEPAWDILRRGKELRIDLPWVEFAGPDGTRQRRYFSQLAGAGLDARAVELVRWDLKKKIGPLAYVYAGLQALREPPAKITFSDGQKSGTGGLVLVGNGRLYGGDYQLFPQADLCDGKLDVCIFPKVNWLTLLLGGPSLLLRGRVPASMTQCFQAQAFKLNAPSNVPFELDGEIVGKLPATFGLEPGRLRVVVGS